VDETSPTGRPIVPLTTPRRVAAAAALLLLAAPATALAASQSAGRTQAAGKAAAGKSTVAKKAAVTTTAPTGFTTYPAPANQAQDAGEPSIGLDPVTGGAMFQAVQQTERVNFSGGSSTWTDVSPLTSKGTTLDPILFTDNRTGRTFASQLLAATSAMSFTDDGGKNWTPSQGGGIGTVFDHQSVGGGPYPAGGVARPLTAYPDAVYYCAQADVTASCARSDNGGLTFGPASPAYTFADGCAGLHGHLRVGPDGTAYLPNFDCNGHASVAVSSDAGTTWKVREVPFSTTQDESDPSVSVGKDGAVYFAWQDGADNTKGSVAKVAVSRDHGATWTLAYTAPGIGNVQFPEMISGDAGRAAVAYLGSPTAGNDQLKAFPGVFHLYVATTYDGGATWSTVDTTPSDPVQRGGISLGGFDPSGQAGAERNLLDFNDITLDKAGRVLVGYADGCTGGCVSDPSKNAYTDSGVIARQSTGNTLFAAYDASGGAATTLN